ncbi:MAG: hypoxanthine phosphoribosyltransferase [Paludibacteraceae bacterium]|nr:hypoxanthine phosphoribosyltransferase [Paludibacteraceae bacterium]
MLPEVTIQDLKFVPLIRPEELQKRVAKLAARMARETDGEDPLFVCMLGGAFVFAADLLRSMETPGELAFVKWSSYEGTSSSGRIREELPLTVPVRGRHVVVVEDIVETGFTLQRFRAQVLEQGAASCRIATLLLKPGCLCCDLHPDWVGFEIGDDFVVGYGLDYNGRGRMLPAIYTKI